MFVGQLAWVADKMRWMVEEWKEGCAKVCKGGWMMWMELVTIALHRSKTKIDCNALILQHWIGRLGGVVNFPNNLWCVKKNGLQEYNV